jgi:hypothetical protein
MKSLVETNAYLRRSGARRRMLQHNALESSIFEGASCLHAEKVAKAVIAAKAVKAAIVAKAAIAAKAAIVAKAVKVAKDKAHVVGPNASRPLSKATAKKAVKGS